MLLPVFSPPPCYCIIVDDGEPMGYNRCVCTITCVYPIGEPAWDTRTTPYLRYERLVRTVPQARRFRRRKHGAP